VPRRCDLEGRQADRRRAGDSRPAPIKGPSQNHNAFLDPLSFPLKLQCCWLVRRPFQGKRLVFVTNNSTKSRKQYGRKFETLGLSVDEVGFLSAVGTPRHEPASVRRFPLLTDETGRVAACFCAGRDLRFVFRSRRVPAVHRFPQGQEGTSRHSK
jgi:hypothetical protein